MFGHHKEIAHPLGSFLHLFKCLSVVTGNTRASVCVITFIVSLWSKLVLVRRFVSVIIETAPDTHT